MTDDRTKTVPCITCGTDVEVHIYAANKLVKCPAHRATAQQKARKRNDVRDPFEPGITLEERQQRAVGSIVTLHRQLDAIEWTEEITVTRLLARGGGSELVEVFGVTGAVFVPPLDPARECGQFHAFTLGEVAGVR